MAERAVSHSFRLCLAVLAAFACVLSLSYELSALETPFDNSKTLKNLTEGPSVRFESEEEKEKAGLLFGEAEIVLSADIKSVTLARMGFGGPPVPTTRILFENVTALKGARPETEKTGYHYRASPEALEKYRGRRILAALDRFDKKEPLYITGLFPATAGFYKILESIGEKCTDEPEPSCAPEAR